MATRLQVPKMSEVLEEPTQFRVFVEYPLLNAEGCKQDNVYGARVYLFSNITNKWEVVGDILFPDNVGVVTVDETGSYAVRYRIITKSTVDPDGNVQCLRLSEPSPAATFAVYTVPSATPPQPVVFGSCPGCADDLPPKLN